MTLAEHAHAIEEAIQAAAEDGFELDNHYGVPPARLDLNRVVDGEPTGDYIELDLPRPTFY